MRRWTRPRGPAALAAVVIAVAGAYQLATSAGRGIYWDEYVQSVYGRNVLRWYGSGFQNHAALEQGNLVLYGAAAEAPLELVASMLPQHRYAVRHLVVGIIGLAGVVGVFLLGVRLGVPWAGAVGALLLVIQPRFLGHTFFNSKDVPFAVLYVWSFVLLVRDVRRPLGAPLRTTLPLGVCLGALWGTRVGGTIILAPVLAGYVLRWWREARTRGNAVLLLARFSAVCFVGWGVMLLAWPWAQGRPLLYPLSALLASGRFPWDNPQLFAGAFMSSLQLPAAYVPTWLLITTPEVTLGGLAALLVAIAVRPARLRALREPGLAAVVVGGLLPVAYVIGSGAALYDGPRHLMFVQPFIALAAAVGLVSTWQRVSAGPRRWAGWVVAAAVGLGALLPLRAMLSLRPYEYVYFNDVSGGLPAASGRYELEYWGLSYREGMEWLAKHPPAEGPARVASCSHPESSRPFVESPFEFVGSPLFGMTGPSDVLVYTAPHDCVVVPPWTPPEGRVLHRVERYGVTLLWVLETAEPFVHDSEGAANAPAVPTARGSRPAPRDSRPDDRSSGPSSAPGRGGAE